MNYLYRHIRLDKNEPFYIGIGTAHYPDTQSWSSYYHRAYVKKRKNNPIWTCIAAKTDYEVEILFESEDIDFIKEKEMEFIKLYGRKDLGTGILANMTDGGDGLINRVITDKERKRRSEAISGENHPNFGNNLSEEVRAKIRNGSKNHKSKLPEDWGEHNRGGNSPYALKVEDTDSGKIYETIKEASEHTTCSYSTLLQWLKKEGVYKNFKLIGKPKPYKKKCRHIESGVIYNSLAEACKDTGESYNYQLKLTRSDKKHKKFEYL